MDVSQPKEKCFTCLLQRTHSGIFEMNSMSGAVPFLILKHLLLAIWFQCRALKGYIWSVACCMIFGNIEDLHKVCLRSYIQNLVTLSY